LARPRKEGSTLGQRDSSNTLLKQKNEDKFYNIVPVDGSRFLVITVIEDQHRFSLTVDYFCMVAPTAARTM
jgi:hypothetical protein